MEWREGRETFTAFKMELQNGVGSLHDNMMKVMDVARAKEGRLMKLDFRNAGMSQEMVDHFKVKGRRLGFQVWKQMVSHFDLRMGADRSVA